MLELPTELIPRLKILYCFWRISSDRKHFGDLRDFIQDQWIDMAKKNMEASGSDMHQRQGAMKTLDVILKILDTCSNEIDQLEQQRKIGQLPGGQATDL